ncbi:MAG TPA: sugar-binding protein [bacterium]|nr:sugar-binding protein [bacterium]HPN41876.1 sugar-binding protein [bacterium]
MKKVLFTFVTLLFLATSFTFGQIADVIYDFEQGVGGWGIGWGSIVTSVTQTNHVEFGGVLEAACVVDSFGTAAVRVDNINLGWTAPGEGPEFVTVDVYVPADFPDSSFMQFYMMDRTHWNWKRTLYSPSYQAGGREMVIGGWNTFTFELARENQVDPVNFVPTTVQTGVEIQIFEPWTGSVLIDNVTLWQGGKVLWDLSENSTGFGTWNKYITVSHAVDPVAGGVLQVDVAVDSITLAAGTDGAIFPDVKYTWTDSTVGEYLLAADVFFPADFPDSGFVQFFQMDKTHWGWERTIYAPVERTGFGGDNSTLIKRDAWNTLVFEVKQQNTLNPATFFPWATIYAGIEINPKGDYTGTLYVDNIRVYPKQETVVVVDGVKDDFYKALTGPDDGYLQMRWFTFTQGALGKIADNDADLSVKLWGAWDEEWFYVYEEVTDDTVSMAGNQPWKNDEIELKIDPVPDDSTKTSNFETRLCALGLEDGLPTTAKVDDLSNIADTLKQFARKTTATGYVLEFAIKWQAIKLGTEIITPAVGNVFGATLQNHDNDGNIERDATVAWGAVLNDDAWKTPKFLGTVKFLADNKLQFIPTNNMTGVTNTVPYDGSFPPVVMDAKKDFLYMTLKTPDDGHFYMPSRAFNANGAPDDDKDCSALVWLAWDSTYMYVYEEVADDSVALNNATNYQVDKIEIKFDPDPSLAPTAGIVDVSLSALDSSDVDPKYYAGVSNRAAGDFARAKTDNGYVLEMRVKWTDIVTTGTAARGPIVPAVGNVFGMSFMNHDSDALARQATIQWSAVMDDKVWNNPQMLGSVEFMPDNKLKLIPVNAITGVANDSAEVWYNPAGITKVSVKENPTMVASEFKLLQNYPNPFNPTTTISFSIVKNGMVRLTVFDILGREVSTLVNEVKPAGSYDVSFDAHELASGVYFYKLESNNNVKTQKMLLIK